MAKRKGPKMLEELLRRRANGDGLQTIAHDLGIARNTVKNRLKEINAYDVGDAKELMASGRPLNNVDTFTPHWSGLVSWPVAVKETEGGTTIKEFWETHVADSDNRDLRNVPYETFWREFRRRYPNLDVYYHKTHEPGLRAEIDYKGDNNGLGFIDRETGEFIPCRFFGQVLCNSKLFFPYATLDEKRESWLSGIEAGVKYFGGTPKYLVVDNSRSTINEADWFDPDVNKEFFNFCQHYGMGVIAARPRRPKDKNLIEVHLGVFWRWIRGKIRRLQFFSIGELNRYLSDMADIFNAHYQRKYGSSRIQRFNESERHTLGALPISNYEYGEWKKARLHEDCHIQHRYNFYSAPYHLRGRDLDVRVTVTNVEIFYQHERIAIHQKRPDRQRGNYSTDKKHLPQKFQAMEELSISRQINEASKVGPNTCKVVTNLLVEVSHPLMFLRRTMGILRLKGKHGATKLERSCEILLRHGKTKPSVKDVERMINSPNLEDKPKSIPIERKPNPHLRGQMSFTLEGVNNYEYQSTTEFNGAVSCGIISEGNPGIPL